MCQFFAKATYQTSWHILWLKRHSWNFCNPRRTFYLSRIFFWDISVAVWHNQIFIPKRSHKVPSSEICKNSWYSMENSLLLILILLEGRAGSLKLCLYIILMTSSRVMPLMKFLIPKWYDAACDVDASLTATRWQLIESYYHHSLLVLLCIIPFTFTGYYLHWFQGFPCNSVQLTIQCTHHRFELSPLLLV